MPSRRAGEVRIVSSGMCAKQPADAEAGRGDLQSFTPFARAPSVSLMQLEASAGADVNEQLSFFSYEIRFRS